MAPVRPNITSRNQKDIRFSAFWERKSSVETGNPYRYNTQLEHVHVKHQLFKNCEKCVKTGNPYTYSDQSGILFDTKMEL